MTSHKTQKGFTLVELAIVMTIIGLLIGGILKGQELMQNARVTATIAQVRSYEAATTTFRDTYASMPGDMLSASARIPNCTVACDPLPASGGNSILGPYGWMSAPATVQAITIANTTQTNERAEATLYWTHMLLADLISGVSTRPLTAAVAPAWGETHPAARINGGFVPGWGDGSALPGSTATTGPSGLILTLLQSPTSVLDNAAGGKPLTATRAAQIDRKMDDGVSTSGFVQAFGLPASCSADVGGVDTYVENAPGNDCGLVFRIQG